MLDAKKYIEIHDYCQKQYKRLEKKEGRYNPKHDRIVMELAAKEFKTSEATINKAFDLVVMTVRKNTASGKVKGSIENMIRKLLYNNLTMQMD